MYILNNKITLPLLVLCLGVVGILIFFYGFQWFWKSAHKDYTDVEITGYIYKNDKPSPKTVLYITNYFYKGGDYDGFGGKTQHRVVADDQGKYYLQLPLSAFVQFDTVAQGYTEAIKNVYINQNMMNIDFYLASDSGDGEPVF